MSTASLPPPSAANQPHPSDELIEERIETVRSALWRSELTRSLLLLVLFLIAAILGWAVIDQWIWSGGPMSRLAAWTATVGLIILWSMRRIVPLFATRIDAAYAAHSIERDLPDIKHALSSYVALRDQRDVSGLRGVVIRSIGSRAAGRLKQHEGALPSEIASSFRLWLVVAIAFAVLAVYTVLSPKDTLHSAGRLILPLSSIEPPTRVRILEVDPGDAEILAGKHLDVTARIAGLTDSDEPHVLWESGGEQRKFPLRTEEDHRLPLFHTSLGASHGIEASGHYTVMAGDAQSKRFRITTSDVPVVRVESAHYQPPAYTKRPERTTRAAAIEGVEGSIVTLVASTNRPIVEAQIELNPRTTGGRTTATAGVFPMQVDSAGTKLTAKIVLRTGTDQPGVVPLSSYRIRVTDSVGAMNPEPVIYSIRILSDLAPEVTIATPVRNPKEIPIDAQQLIEVHALDPDFGLTRIALQMHRGAQRLDDVVLWEDDDTAPRNRIALYRFRPRELGFHPGDVVQIRAVAADNRQHPTKQTPASNVTVSDPVELRIVDAANMSESRPREDGLSAPDDQPAVEPPKNGQSEDQDQQTGGDDSATGSSDAGGSADESAGDAGDDGAPSEGTANGEQEGASSSGEGGQGSDEGADDSTGDDDSSQSPAGEATGDDGSAGEDATGADPASQPTSPQTETDQEQTPSTSPDPGTESQSATRSGAQDSDAPTPSPQENAEPSAGDDGASTATERAGEGMDGEQTGEAEPRQGTDADERRDQSSSPPSPPEHDGEAMERIKEYLDERQQDHSKPSPAEQSPDQRNGETNVDDGATEQQTPAGDTSQETNDRDPTSREPSASDDAAAEQAMSPEGDASDRRGQSGDPTDQQNGDAPSTGDASDETSEDETSRNETSRNETSGDETSGDGDPTGDASETESDSESSQGDSADEESEPQRDPSTSPGDPTDEASTDTEADPSESDETGSDPVDSSAPSDTDATPSPQDPAASDSPDRESSGSPADQPPADGQPGTADGTEHDSDAAPSSSDDSATTGRAGSTGSGEPTSDFVESDETPEPVDLEYAKKATDMVLDYLKETRDQPDQELLDRLNWSEEDLDRFLRRWESARQMERGDGGDGSQEFEEALRSLGIRDRSTADRGAEADGADQLRDLRDSGTRRPAPALYRDAFEAFRRSVAR